MRSAATDRLPLEAQSAVDELSHSLAGEVRADRLSRTLYATDGSIYQIVPYGVVFPRSADDVVATVRACGRHSVPLTARGAGTGLAGGAVNRGLILDCSRFLNRIIDIDPRRRLARVEPGVVLDELNAALKPHGLQFPPDVATSSRATVGGMIANNSCGAHSVIYGRTVDHIVALDVVLSDGSACSWGRGAVDRVNPLAHRCDQALATIVREYGDEIAARFPKVSRSNAGYGLDRLRFENGRLNTEALLSGSEGTLCVVVGASLNLVPLPKFKGLVVAHFDDLLAAMEATPIALEHGPAAVELIDRPILEAAKISPNMARHRSFIVGDPDAVLVVEMYDDRESSLAERLRGVAADFEARRLGYAWPVLSDAGQQADVWVVRKAGLGLAQSKPGPWQPMAFVEDTAVNPAKLRAYIERFRAILAEEGIERAGYYAHASVGCLHIRPVLNLKLREDVERMRRIGDRVSRLAMEFGGTITGEHGDGIVRSGWLETLYGPRIVEAFGKVKQAFDPHGLFNPNKIVAPPPMTENLRFAAEDAAADEETYLDFSAYGGMAGLAEMCSGIGECRQRLVGTMCPSYRATGDERDTTRARANALRIALSGGGLLQGLSDPALAEVLDLCLSCKACKTECPTGVDMARLKAEWLARRYRRIGAPRRSNLIAAVPELAAWGSRLAPLSNWVMQAGWVRGLMELFCGMDRRVPLPRFARQTFRRWFAEHQRDRRDPPADTQRQVVYFVDTWTNYYTPQVGVAAVKVLEALGYEVIVPRTKCCGRPAISKGLLWKAVPLAKANVSILAPYAHRGIPIVGTEPSCVLTFTDEYPQLVRTPEARSLAQAAQTIENFIAACLEERPDALRFKTDTNVLYHGHCHQKALVGTQAAMGVLNACTGGRAKEIDSGCCGMAGSFGHEVEHYDVAKAVGEQRLFPAVRGRGDAEIAVSGFSCRHQIEHHTGVTARHFIEYVAEAIAPPPS
jgi:FAD/FMN-containing dehydrogenase/Fe-S oxidoreductase